MSKINDLDMNNWKQYDDTVKTDSLWIIDKRDNSGAHHAGYHGLFIPEIPRQAMLRYTKKGDFVLDPFAGSGTTLIEARRLGRNCIGVDLNPAVCQRAINAAYNEPNPHGVMSYMLHDNATDENAYAHVNYILAQNNINNYGVDLIILHPPYHNIIQFSSNKYDLSNCETVEQFVKNMEVVFNHCYQALKRGHYMVLVVGDYYAKSEHVPLSYMLMQQALTSGFKLKSHVVKNIENNRGKANQINLWRYRALMGGFYIFKHENIFFFWKP